MIKKLISFFKAKEPEQYWLISTCNISFKSFKSGPYDKDIALILMNNGGGYDHTRTMEKVQ